MIDRFLNASFEHFNYMSPNAHLLKCLADSCRLKSRPIGPQLFLRARWSPHSSATCAHLMRPFSHVRCRLQHFIVHTHLKSTMPLHDPLRHIGYRSLQLMRQSIFAMHVQLQHLAPTSVPRCSTMQQPSIDFVLWPTITSLSTVHLDQHICSTSELV